MKPDYEEVEDEQDESSLEQLDEMFLLSSEARYTAGSAALCSCCCVGSRACHVFVGCAWSFDSGYLSLGKHLIPSIEMADSQSSDTYYKVPAPAPMATRYQNVAVGCDRVLFGGVGMCCTESLLAANQLFEMFTIYEKTSYIPVRIGSDARGTPRRVFTLGRIIRACVG